MTNEPLTTAQIAKYCHVSNRAVLKWIADGKLRSYRTPGMHARVRPEDFINFLKAYQFPIPAEYKDFVTKQRILIVDDDRDIVGMLKRILMMQKEYEVDVAFDGFSAGKKFAEFNPDVIVLDIRMPLMDGYAVLKMIRDEHHNKHIKIISISGGDESDLNRARELGADDVLAKPFDYQVLLTKIKQLIGANM